jgi:putative transcriptional regulator
LEQSQAIKSLIDMNFNEMPQPRVAVAKTKLLIAQPFLQDKHFERSVILICEHENQGTFGFILTRPTNLAVSEVIEVSSFDQILHIGGPVEQNTLHFIHTLPEIPKALPLKDGVYWGGDFEYVKSLAIANRLNAENSRFFVGYSGWGKDQLLQEVQENSWFVVDYDLQFIFEQEGEKLWHNILKNLGGRYKVFANYPKDPKLN